MIWYSWFGVPWFCLVSFYWSFEFTCTFIPFDRSHVAVVRDPMQVPQRQCLDLATRRIEFGVNAQCL